MLIVPVNNLSPFSLHLYFDKLSLKLTELVTKLMVCVHLISLIAHTAVLMNDAISLVFECPILSGVMNMHTFSYCHSIYIYIYAYFKRWIHLHIFFILFILHKAYCRIIRKTTLFSALMEWLASVFLTYLVHLSFCLFAPLTVSSLCCVLI